MHELGPPSGTWSTTHIFHFGHDVILSPSIFKLDERPQLQWMSCCLEELHESSDHRLRVLTKKHQENSQLPALSSPRVSR